MLLDRQVLLHRGQFVVHGRGSLFLLLLRLPWLFELMLPQAETEVSEDA